MDPPEKIENTPLRVDPGHYIIAYSTVYAHKYINITIDYKYSSINTIVPIYNQ